MAERAAESHLYSSSVPDRIRSASWDVSHYVGGARSSTINTQARSHRPAAGGEIIMEMPVISWPGGFRTVRRRDAAARTGRAQRTITKRMCPAHPHQQQN